MHVRVRFFGKPEAIVVVESKLTKIEQFRRLIRDKFDVDPKLQRLFYGGKLLEDGYTFHDYNIKLNDVIQLMVRAQPIKEPKNEEEKKEKSADKPSNSDADIDYEDAKSSLYAVGDLVDMKDKEMGAWFEGRVDRIVYDPSSDIARPSKNKDGIENVENKPPQKSNSPNGTKKVPSEKNSITNYFSQSPKGSKKSTSKAKDKSAPADAGLLYKVILDASESNEENEHYCKPDQVRPRARKIIDIKDLKVGQKVMINHNTDDPLEKGYWYDFKIAEIKKLRTNHELIGTLYLGLDAVPQNDTKARVVDRIFAIEEVVPLADRTEEYSKMMTTLTDKRSAPLYCLTCRDEEDATCKDCGCYSCSGKENPEKIILCDECNHGYHMECLDPPLTVLPEDYWYCPSCKRDDTVVAPGAAKQTKKASKSKRDWGRGMACVGKTKTSAMPANHFGPIPGIEVGMCWRFRIQLSETGVHRPPVSGIHGRDVEGAYSIVLSGGYEDDVDHGDEFTYTGSGGRDLSGNKRTAEQSCDQTLTRENKALARNCAVKQISEEGGDAGDNWRDGKPVRVVRSYKMLKHFPEYAPKEGIRYDGIYKVVKYYPEEGKSGFRVWKYLLRRDDPSPAPWEEGSKEYPIIYPDGYLEAEAEKKALKEKGNKSAKGSKKRGLSKAEPSSESGDEARPASPPSKKKKTSSPETTKKRGRPSKNQSMTESPKGKIASIFATAAKNSPNNTKKSSVIVDEVLSKDEVENIKADNVNSKLWAECLEVCKEKGKKDFVEQVTQIFLCIICQEVAANPVTTSCLHNFCMSCMKLAFKSTGTQSCPYCRRDLAKEQLQPNEKLKVALQTIMPGYDAGKK